MNRWRKNLISTSRGNFEVFVKGKGEPLCVTHHYSEFNETGDYFAETFTKTHRVYLVNLRETGNSEKALEPYQLSMLETIFDLEAIREALGLDQWGFAGHSTGGMLGIIYGIYFSNSLRYNIIVGASAREYLTFSSECIYNSDHPRFTRMQELNESLKRSDLSAEARKELSIERTKMSLFEPKRYSELFKLNITKKMSAARLNYFSRELQIYDVTKKLKLITSPTLIMCGKYDVQCPLPYSLEMKELIPNSKLVIFNESNHYPFLEESKLFSKELDLFLEEQLTRFN
ncbi:MULTISPECIES: alpha/beta fold hydrolase [Bacillus cereus group]|uniref:Alpha/beta hydrolase n=1 Tax=Bacillus cereus TaxID=1396 RepID=A0A9W7QEA2_BACCE|nr:alpha/beta hydrolase [Bacillus cereus]KAB2391112.1 alpha/beta hydrolase [Bacillus cereus]KAB2407388.1 alpha/beta hydrolase [Bacillus cereus]KAB2428635.1 alpha/beta hydrolase [Bacillus cereus]